MKSADDGLIIIVKKEESAAEVSYLTLWHPGGFGDFRKKKRLNTRGFAREFLQFGMLYRPGTSLKRHGTSSSLHSKKFFLLGECRFFVSDIISGGLCGHLALGANR